jgi:hypothetical protein
MEDDNFVRTPFQNVFVIRDGDLIIDDDVVLARDVVGFDYHWNFGGPVIIMFIAITAAIFIIRAAIIFVGVWPGIENHPWLAFLVALGIFVFIAGKLLRCQLTLSMRDGSELAIVGENFRVVSFIKRTIAKRTPGSFRVNLANGRIEKM